MTIEDYYSGLKALGLSRVAQPVVGTWLCRTRDGQVTAVPSPEGLTPEEREDAMMLLRRRHNALDC